MINSLQKPIWKHFFRCLIIVHLLKFNTSSNQMLRQLFISCIMWTHPQVPSITINDGWVWRSVAIDEGVDTATNPNYVSSDNYGSILTLLNSAHFANSRHKNSAVDTCLDQDILDASVYINITFFTTNNAQLALVSIVGVEVSIILNAHTFIQII